MDLDFILMMPADNPLVALATQLGYVIFINVRPLPPGATSPRYRGDLPKGVRHYDDDLLSLITRLIQDDRASLQLHQPPVPQDQPTQPEREQLRNQVEDQKQEIGQLERTIIDLKRQLDLEHRFLIDTQARGFLSFLKRQPTTPFIQKLLDDPFFSLNNQAARWTYEFHLRQQKRCSDEELEEFKNLWKVLLLETPRSGF